MNDWMNHIRLGSQWFSGIVCVHKRFQLSACRKFVHTLTHTHKLCDKSWVRWIDLCKNAWHGQKTDENDNFSIIIIWWPYQCSMGFELIMIWQSFKKNTIRINKLKPLAPEFFLDHAKSDSRNAMQWRWRRGRKHRQHRLSCYRSYNVRHHEMFSLTTKKFQRNAAHTSTAHIFPLMRCRLSYRMFGSVTGLLFKEK